MCGHQHKHSYNIVDVFTSSATRQDLFKIMDSKRNRTAIIICIALIAITYLQLASAQKAKGEGRRRNDCPLCDSSVFGYCSDKLLHDACCCLNPYENQLPYTCRLADCSFLHANNCIESELIAACCCNRVF